MDSKETVMSWIQKASARLDEMSQGKYSLRVERHGDGDIALYIDSEGAPIYDDEGKMVKVEFCSTSGGGGRSPRTRAALLNLMEAMLLDNMTDEQGIPEFPQYLNEAIRQEISVREKMKLCGIITPRREQLLGLGEDLAAGYLPECILPQTHGESHVFLTPGGKYFKWQDDYDCGCCTPEEDERCYSIGEISTEEAVKLIKERD